MKKLFYILIFFAFGAQAQPKMPADTGFLYTYGGTNFDEARDIKEMPDKGYIVVGTTSSFGQGDASVYMIKTDALGNHVWSSVQGGAVNDWAYTVQLTPDSGIFVAGYSNSFNGNGHNYFSPYYLKTDKKGVLLWQRNVDVGSWSFIYGSYALPDSGFILCGQTYYATPDGSSDAYLMRITKNGDTVWTNHYGGIQDEIFNSVCVINHKIYAVGSNATHATDTVADGWLVKLDMAGNKLQETFISYGPKQKEVLNGISIYNDTMFSVCGNRDHLDSNVTTGLAARYDTSLIIIQDITYLNGLYSLSNNPATTLFNKVINISHGNTCIIGTKSGGLGGLGMFFVGFDNLGYNIPGFYPNVGGTLDDYGYSIIYASSGKVIAVGSTLSTSDYCTNNNLGIEDVFLVRFDSDSIDNNTYHHNQYSCFADTLFLWQTNIKSYVNNFNLKLFPNPINNNATLYITSTSNEEYEAKVFSLLGDEVMSIKINPNTNVDFNVSGLNNGTYFVKVFNRNNSILSTLKFTVIN
jgi:hypothetical protein